MNSRDGVHEMWSLSSIFVPIFKHILQATLTIGGHAFVVDLYWYYVQASRSGGLNGIHIRELFTENAFSFSDPISLLIPDVAECLYGFRESVCGATCENDLRPIPVWAVGMKICLRELSDEAVEWWISLSCSILKGCCNIDLAQDILLSGIVRYKYAGSVGIL